MRAAALFTKATYGQRYRQHSQHEEEEADHLIPKDMDGPCNPRQDMDH